MAYPTAYAGILEAIRKQMAPHVAEPRIAITELQLFTNRPHLPNNQSLAEALFLAGTLHTAIRTGGLVELINHTANVNHGGGLRKDREIVYPNPVYFTSKLYATQPGARPVGLRVATPMVDVPPRGGLPAVRNSPYLDAVALASEAGDELVVLAVNRHPDRALPARIQLRDFPAQATVRVQTLRGNRFLDANSWREPDRVCLHDERRQLAGRPPRFDFEPCSVTALTFRRAR
jgi:alpha-N-arabinofuranosidase